MRIVVSVESSVMIVMRWNHMMVIFMVARHMVSMGIDDHMVLVPRMGLVVTVVMMLSEDWRGAEDRTDCQQGKHESCLH